MAQAIVLAVGTSAATSSDITVAAGATVTVGIYPASGDLAANSLAYLYVDSPGADVLHSVLDINNKVVVIIGPCTARVARQATGASFGVWTES